MVVVVIGILVALLLPTLTRVRDRAKEAVCLGNFHQIGIGLKLYQGDNNGRYPLGGTLISNPGALIPRGTPRDQTWSFTTALGGKDGKGPLLMLPPAKVRPLNRYVTEPRTFQCPADGGIDYRANGGPHWASLWETFGCSYQYNASGGNPRLERALINDKDDGWVSQASRFVVLYEPPAIRESWDSQPFRVYWHRAHPPRTINSHGDEGAGSRRVSPILYADGHAEIVDFTGEVFSRVNSDRRLWNQPE